MGGVDAGKLGILRRQQPLMPKHAPSDSAATRPRLVAIEESARVPYEFISNRPFCSAH
jgi:hypothetical protein